MKIETNNSYRNIFYITGKKNNEEKSYKINIKENPQDYSFAKNCTIPDPVSRTRLVSERYKLLKPLNKDEYTNLINKISSDDYTKNPPYVYIGEYKDTPLEFMGLVPYCGDKDIHNEINCWLTGRFHKGIADVEDEKISNIVNALDYSLKRLDEKFGKYWGIVYRYGFFNPLTDKQYYSSSTSAYGALKFAIDAVPSKKHPYSIIKLKNGHSIYDFQKYANNKYSKICADIEKEVLIDRKSKFRLIPEEEYTEEDLKLREKFLAIAVTDEEEVTQQDIKFAVEEYDDRLKYISIWEEI